MFIKPAHLQYNEMAAIDFIDELDGREARTLDVKDLSETERARICSLLAVMPYRRLQPLIDDLLAKRDKIIARDKEAYRHAKKLDGYLSLYGFITAEADENRIYLPSVLDDIGPQTYMPSTEIAEKLGLNANRLFDVIDDIMTEIRAEYPFFATLLRWKFGLGDYNDPCSYAEIARIIGFTKEEVKYKVKEAIVVAQNKYPAYAAALL